MNVALSRNQFPLPAEALKPDRAHTRHHLEVVSNPKAQLNHALSRETFGINKNAAVPEILFGPFRLLPAQRLLLEGDMPVRLGSRALEILIILVEQHGELVNKRALMERVWPDTTVVEANLSVHIAALRRALRDGRSGNRYLVNMPGRGYRFVAPITLLEDSQPSSAREWVSEPLELTEQPTQARPSTKGSDGIGKSALALACSETQTDAAEPGVWMIDLGSLIEPEIAGAVAAALGGENRTEQPLSGLLTALKHKRVLLLLDDRAQGAPDATSRQG